MGWGGGDLTTPLESKKKKSLRSHLKEPIQTFRTQPIIVRLIMQQGYSRTEAYLCIIASISCQSYILFFSHYVDCVLRETLTLRNGRLEDESKREKERVRERESQSETAPYYTAILSLLVRTPSVSPSLFVFVRTFL